MKGQLHNHSFPECWTIQIALIENSKNPSSKQASECAQFPHWVSLLVHHLDDTK